MLSENRHRFSRLIMSLGYFGTGTGISPNGWTALGLAFGIASAYFIATGNIIAGAILLAVSGIVDVIDGAVARMCKKATDWGALFDRASDKYIEGSIIFAIAYTAPAYIMPSMVWGFLAVWGSVMISSISTLGSSRAGKDAYKLAGRAERIIVMIFGLFLAGFLGAVYLAYTLIALAFLSHLTALSLVFQYFRILRGK